jgi:NitT/TauT family transport system permease protein
MSASSSFALHPAVAGRCVERGRRAPVGPRTYRHIWVTLFETVAGFAIAVVIGITFGGFLGKIRWLERTLNPLIVGLQVMPKVALIPLFIVWFGFGMTSKVVLAAVIAFFPIMTNTILGIKSVERGHRDVMLALNASRWATFRDVELPNALPFILTGMEVGIVLATIGAIVGEYLGGSQGLGYMAVATLNAFDVKAMFGVIMLLTVLGLVLYFLVVLLRRYVTPWHESVAGQR